MSRTLALAIATVAAMSFSAVPADAAETLDFSGNVCGAGTDQPCVDNQQIGSGYGDGPGVDVSYRSFDSGTGNTLDPSLNYWSSDYGDLDGVVWGGLDALNYVSEITFTARPGYELTLLGFDAGCYMNTPSCSSFGYSISEILGKGSSGGSASGTLPPPQGGHDSAILNLAYSKTGYILRWGPDSYNGGLDNIRFDVRALAAVPEPSTWLMMLFGVGVVGVGLRRGRRRGNTLAAA